MKQLRIGTLTAAFAGLSTLGISSAAFAQAPCGDRACEPGFECEVAEAPCGGSCYETDDGEVVCEEYECSTELYYYCAPKACETDADCGDVMVCGTFESTECSASVSSDCDDDSSDCEKVEEESTCTTSEYQQCTYRHELPCESDEQCGDGFTCVEAESCWCSGSSGNSDEESDDTDESPGSDDGDDASDDGDDASDDGDGTTESDVDCGCEPSGEKYCHAASIECATEADCPSGWSCVPGPESCWGDESGVIGCETEPSTCQPPGSGGGIGNDDDPIVDEPGDRDEEEWSGDDDSAPKGEGGNTTDDGDAEEDDEDGDDGRPHADLSGIWSLFGCSVKQAPAQGNFGAFAWLAAAVGLVVARRRSGS